MAVGAPGVVVPVQGQLLAPLRPPEQPEGGLAVGGDVVYQQTDLQLLNLNSVTTLSSNLI